MTAYGGADPPVADVPLVTIHADRPGDRRGRATRSQQAADALRDALLSGSGQSRLEAAGFRGRDGGLDSRFTPAGR